MDLDEWYETVQRWRAPATGHRWRRLPKVAAAGLATIGLAVGATQLSDGGRPSSIAPVAAAPTGLPVEDVGTTATAAPPSGPSSTATTAPAAAPTSAAPPVDTATSEPPATMALSAAAPATAPATAPAPPSTARPAPPPSTAPPPAPPPPPPPTTAAPAPAPAPAPPASGSGRLSARMGVNPSPAAVGQAIAFSAGWTDTNGQLASMGIEFGDGGGAHRNGPPCGPGPAGSRSGTESFSHAYGAPGTYTVRLHVHTDDCTGGRQATVVTISVTVR